MKFVIGQIMHETHTFVSDTVPLKDFNFSGGDVPLEGEEAIEARRGGNTAVAAYIDLAESIGAEYVVPVAGMAWPSGPVEDAAFDYMSSKVIAAVNEGCDAVLLELHGAMSTESHKDAEGELLQRIRKVSPDIPIAVALDFHCIITPKMVNNATVITVYRTIPHVDIYETGQRAGKTLLGLLKGENRPLLVARRIPLMASLEKMSEKTPPMKDLIELIHEMESHGAGILNASLSGGHPFSDIPPGGMTAIMVTDADCEAGAAAAEKLLKLAWLNREDLIFPVEPYQQSLSYAKSLSEGPIIMADSGDIPSSGGYGADMTVLKKAIAMGFEDVCVGPIFDPESARKMFDAGTGRAITIDLGGKTNIPLLNYSGESLRVSGTIQMVTDRPIKMTGPMLRGMTLSLGRMAVLSTGTMEILVTEKRGEALDLEIFRHVGIDPEGKKYTLIKSRQHFQAAFGPIAKHMIRISGPGPTNPDFSGLPYRYIERPMFPLDKDTTFHIDKLGS